MNSFNAAKFKNIAIIGHNGSGKTSLAEALLFKVGVIDRLGKVAEGNTICDYDAEETKRQISINTALANFKYDEFRINLLDTPGIFDFQGNINEGIRACDTAMITVSGKSGVKVGTQKAYKIATDLKKSKMFVITKLDDPNADFYKVFEQLKSAFGPTVCPIVVPVINDGKIEAYINLIEMKAYAYDANGQVKEVEMPEIEHRLQGLIEAVSEAVAETDDELFEKFFSGEQFTQKELIKGIHKGMNNGVITPVTCISAVNLAGIDMLLKEIELLLPQPAELPIHKAANIKDNSIIEIECNPAAPLSAFVFKTVADPFVGKMSYIKVMSGKLAVNSEVMNARSGQIEKLGKLYSMCGKKQEEISEAYAGDIIVATKISANTCDTLCDPSRIVSFANTPYPKPCYSMAVKAKAQGDESKISAGIQRLLEEDLTLSYTQDLSTKQPILSGLGEQHIDIAISKLKNKFGVEVILSEPKIAYKETIRKKVKVEGKYKKQSGGHGQYGHVWLEFEPCVSDDLVFEEKVFGGAVPRNYFPAVEKGLQDCIKKGILAGCPVVGLKAILVDGSYHAVDSSEMAFKMAAAIAYKEGIKQADPIMLEPIGNLCVSVPDDKTGDVMGELNKRRGRVLGMSPLENETAITEILAEVPMREMHDFAMYIRQVTKGMGEFTLEFLRYEALPSNLLANVILEAGNLGSSDT